ncbi:hypothetical protein AMTR_s00029p00228930, partial [Amborella trichopoda]
MPKGPRSPKELPSKLRIKFLSVAYLLCLGLGLIETIVFQSWNQFVKPISNIAIRSCAKFNNLIQWNSHLAIPQEKRDAQCSGSRYTIPQDLKEAKLSSQPENNSIVS